MHHMGIIFLWWIQNHCKYYYILSLVFTQCLQSVRPAFQWFMKENARGCEILLYILRGSDDFEIPHSQCWYFIWKWRFHSITAAIENTFQTRSKSHILTQNGIAIPVHFKFFRVQYHLPTAFRKDYTKRVPYLIVCKWYPRGYPFGKKVLFVPIVPQGYCFRTLSDSDLSKGYWSVEDMRWSTFNSLFYDIIFSEIGIVLKAGPWKLFKAWCCISSL